MSDHTRIKAQQRRHILAAIQDRALKRNNVALHLWVASASRCIMTDDDLPPLDTEARRRYPVNGKISIHVG